MGLKKYRGSCCEGIQFFHHTWAMTQLAGFSVFRDRSCMRAQGTSDEWKSWLKLGVYFGYLFV
jgi:hypothetical protein